ncbi:arginine--tRNA ligase [Thermomonospora catenispora]|uniref:arginine--tRNA ligase n=1 Tax=Thermomonospora catenispora TaxID=2493090 RepID=UPI00112021C9|nr:arginine--tRNA ligase [Thermomonospora catenispora]TNY36971.1 arginine--tRNA ligase [Thermomonospora catenispora]
MADVEELLRRRLAPAFEAVAGQPVDPAVRRSQHADFQSDAALALRRRLGGNPRDIAARVVERAELDDLCSKVEISGPGFINLTLSNEAIGRLLAEAAADERLGVPEAERPEVVTVDYSAPNAAKEMHVGHLRSTIIGDATVRLLEFCGHTVIRQNHLGDWGTPFGMLVEHLLDIGEAEAAHELSVGDLNGFYQAARRKFDADPAFQERSRRRVVLLQSGDEATLRLWRMLITESQKYFLAVYRLLGAKLDENDFYGESYYNDQLESVVDELEELGLLRESEGAKCVFPEGFTGRDGEPLPLIVRKSDGGFGYPATDLATIRHRLRKLHATRLVYVVGLPQRLHLDMIFQTAREAGWLTPPARAEHIGFGSVLGSDGKILRTRAGASVKLVDLLEEAVNRASAIVAEKNPDLDAETRAAVAKAVGIGAVKYADLSTDRVKDYVFDYDRMLSFDGNTAPYLQYARARICSIFRKGGIEPPRDVPPLTLTEPTERALALQLLGFEGVVAQIVENLEFHRLAQYLYSLATAFTAFYENCPVLNAEGEVRTARLVLCDLTARTLKLGLDLLGIESPDQM